VLAAVAAIASDCRCCKNETTHCGTCGQCHADRLEQFKKGKHPLAWAAMEAMPTSKHGVREELKQMKIRSEASNSPTCQTCHM
jgi:hypothetical protein